MGYRQPESPAQANALWWVFKCLSVHPEIIRKPHSMKQINLLDNSLAKTPEPGNVGDLDSELQDCQPHQLPVKMNRLMKHVILPLSAVFLLNSGHPTFAAVTGYSVVKEERFFQGSTSTPTADSTTPWRMSADVQVGAQSDLTGSATVTSPGGSGGNLTVAWDASNNQYKSRTTSATQAALDAAFFDGTYVMKMTLAGPVVKNINLAINPGGSPSSYNYSTDIPQILQVNGATPTWVTISGTPYLQLNPSISNTLTWNTFTKLEQNDLIGLDLGTNNPFQQFTTQTTSFTIVAGTYTAGQTYGGKLEFDHLTAKDTDTVSGATGQAGYGVKTGFNIQAIPEPSTVLMFAAGILTLASATRLRKGKTQIA